MFMLILGFCLGTFIFEPIIINFVYFSNIALFTDIILTKKNRNKLKDYYKELLYECNQCKWFTW